MKKTFFFTVLLSAFLFSAQFHFKFYKKESPISGNTLLVIGGIHGNEPGGYYSAAFLVRFYQIKKGALWIVPNLNMDSIMKFKRGIYGDMNRKFAYVSKKDKDYKIVNDIKKIILNPQVDMILNLHDGHGFYRNSWQNSIFNPSAWGQTCIIDQKKIDSKFGNLEEIAKNVSKNLNSDLKKDYHYFNVKNTKTKFKDEQMRLSLTYFAITHSKPAFAIETSKNIKDLPTKIYYQLRAIEEYMKILGIKYKRSFPLTISAIKKLLKNKGTAVLNSNVILPLTDIKENIYFFPVVGKKLTVKSDNPLVEVKKEGKNFVIYEAYNKLTTLHPQYFKNTCSIESLEMEIDGKKVPAKVPSVVKVEKYFKIFPQKDIRINVIGYSAGRETGVKIYKKSLLKKYAIDKNSRIFRIEIYKKNAFCGTVLVEFKGQ